MSEALDLTDLPPELLRELRLWPVVNQDAVVGVLEGRLTQAELARKLGTSRQRVNYHVKKSKSKSG